MRQYKLSLEKGRNAISSCVLILLSSIIIGQTSCKKLVEVDAPITSTNSAIVYASDATAAAVLTGIYSNISLRNSSTFSSFGLSSISLFPALSADELTLFNSNNNLLSPYYTNSLTDLTTGIADFWNNIYPIIFVTNSAIEGLANSTTLTPAVQQQLMGEAKFVRAFCYFYLVNLYGDVPLAISTDYKVNALLTRAPKAQVWQQIITDLKDAQNLLSNNYLKADILGTTTERVRPTKWAATAVLARTYLFTGDYVNAEMQATNVINNISLYGLSILNNTFKMNTSEAIWQLQPVRNGVNSNTGEGALFILPTTGPNNNNYPVYLSDSIVNSFEVGDQRKQNWTGKITITTSGVSTTYYYPFKYKIGLVNTPVSEYIMVLRLAEQYLIRAEARAQQGDTSGAKSDLNTIRTRAGLPNSLATTQSKLLTAIQEERKLELFTEWGHRWLDLKRTGNLDAVMKVITPKKGGIWSSNWQHYPIPQSELQKAPSLVQNPGY